MQLKLKLYDANISSQPDQFNATQPRHMLHKQIYKRMNNSKNNSLNMSTPKEEEEEQQHVVVAYTAKRSERCNQKKKIKVSPENKEILKYEEERINEMNKQTNNC